MSLPSGCHEEVLYLQPMIPPKRFDIFPPNWGMLRRSGRVQIFLKNNMVLEKDDVKNDVFQKNLNASKPSEHPPSG